MEIGNFGLRGVHSKTRIRRSGAGYGRGRNNTPSTTVKISVLTATADESAATVISVNPGWCFSAAMAWRRSSAVPSSHLSPRWSGTCSKAAASSSSFRRRNAASTCRRTSRNPAIFPPIYGAWCAQSSQFGQICIRPVARASRPCEASLTRVGMAGTDMPRLACE